MCSSNSTVKGRENEHESVVKLLLEKGVDPDLRVSINALHYHQQHGMAMNQWSNSCLRKVLIQNLRMNVAELHCHGLQSRGVMQMWNCYDGISIRRLNLHLYLTSLLLFLLLPFHRLWLLIGIPKCEGRVFEAIDESKR